MHKKLELKGGERVKFKNTGSYLLDSKKGTVLGINTISLIDTYIIQLDEPISYFGYTQKAVVIPESCIEVI